MNQRAVGYVRVSTAGQATDGVSMGAQTARIRTWCDANGYSLAETFTDAGISGKRADNRPGLRRALDAACKQRAALVVYSLSRLARSTRDAIEIAERTARVGMIATAWTLLLDAIAALVVRRIRDSATAPRFGHRINKRCPIRPDLAEKHVESGRIGVQSEAAN